VYAVEAVSAGLCLKLIRNQQVAGSIPAGGSFEIGYLRCAEEVKSRFR